MARKNDGTKNLKPFKKGKDVRRNLKGRPTILPELKEALAKVLAEDKDGITTLEAIIRAAKDKALAGDVAAFNTLLDRGFGKVAQPIEHDGEIIIRREIIK